MSMKNLVQFENDFTQSINRLEAQMNRLINKVKDRNKKTLPNTFLIIHDCPNILIGTNNHGVLKTLNKIQFHQTNLNLTNLKFLTNWQVFHSMRLNLNVYVTPILNFVI